MNAFGLLSYQTTNLGDEIQSIAARRFLPRVDRFFDREGLPCTDGDPGPVRLILNGWFLHAPQTWPPHPSIRPLITSFHLSQKRPSSWRLWQPVPSKVLLSPRRVHYLREHGPVGARDMATLHLLDEHEVESYYSACLTLTLRTATARRDERVVACDLPADLLVELSARTSRPPLVVSHEDPETLGAAARMAKAEALLDLYAGAKAVITTRLHCALPCLALGTPVLFIPDPPDPMRQQPGIEFAHSASREDFLARRDGFDPENPPPNPDLHHRYARDLVQRCEDFVASA